MAVRHGEVPISTYTLQARDGLGLLVSPHARHRDGTTRLGTPKVCRYLGTNNESVWTKVSSKWFRKEKGGIEKGGAGMVADFGIPPLTREKKMRWYLS